MCDYAQSAVHLLRPLRIRNICIWALSACAYVNYVQRRDMSHMHTIVFIWTVALSNKNNRKARALTFLAFSASSLLNVLGTDIYFFECHRMYLCGQTFAHNGGDKRARSSRCNALCADKRSSRIQINNLSVRDLLVYIWIRGQERGEYGLSRP